MDELRLIAQWVSWPAIVAFLLLAGGWRIRLLNDRIEYLKDINAQLERELNKQHTSRKPMKHYVLFWWKGERDWAMSDWNAAQQYIAKFRLTCGFSRSEAANAELVTIVGAPSGVDTGAEQFLRDVGCQVERLDGNSQEATMELLNERVRTNTAFEGGLHRRGY